MPTTELFYVEKRGDLLADIGKVTVRWAALDLLLVDILDVVLKSRKAAVGLILTPHNAGAQRLDVFKDVVGSSWLGEEDRKAIIKSIQTFKALLGERNRIVHSPLTTQVAVNGKKLRFDVAFISGTGETRDLHNTKRHAEKVGTELTKLQEIYFSLRDRFYVDPDTDEEANLDGYRSES